MLSFCFQRQLERFVPFMLQCSLGQKFLDKYTPPPKWWPEDLPFSIHVKKPVGMHDVSTLGVYKSFSQLRYRIHSMLTACVMCTQRK